MLARVVSFAIAIALCAGLLFAATPARAADDPAAEALISRGIELREKGKDDEALVLFRQAYAKAPSARARAQVALAEQALGLWVNAESDLVAALEAGDDPWIAKNRGALEGALAIVRRRLGSLEVRGTDGAEVLLDGVRLGVLPSVPFRVEAGTRRLEVRGGGYHAATRVVEVPAGGVARETVTLVKATEPTDEAGGGAPGRAAADTGEGQRVLGYVLGGLGLGMAGVGTVILLVREGEKADYNADTTCPGLGKPQPKACDDRIQKIGTLLTASVTSYVAGGVFLIGGVTLLLTAPKAARGPAGATSSRGRDRRAGLPFLCAPGVGPTDATLVCSGTF